MQPKEWMRVLGLTAGVLEIVVGYPLAIITAQQLERFSLFSLAPISSTILVVLFLMPTIWWKIEGPAE
jgi:ABC-type dipeptide/oligopeptide/nickel transport system permease component